MSLFNDVADAVTFEGRALHVTALVNSLIAGHHGFISDYYLAARGSWTQSLVRELRRAGIWRRVPGGYRPTENQVLRVVTALAEALDAFSDRLETSQRTTSPPAALTLVELAGAAVDADLQPGHPRTGR